MNSLSESMHSFQALLAEGKVQTAYRGLMEFMMDLKTHMVKKYPEYDVSGTLYQGYMDMTYFAFTPKALKERGLKIPIVFDFDDFRFEVWLSGTNKKFQTKYWELVKKLGWEEFHIVPSVKGYDSIVEHTLVEDPDFGNLKQLTDEIESGTLAFIREVEKFLSKLEK